MTKNDIDCFQAYRLDLVKRISKVKHIQEPPFKIRAKIETCLKYKHPIPTSIREVWGEYIQSIKYDNR